MPPPAAPSHSIFASSSWAFATSPWSFCACFMSALRSGILGLDIGLDLLDRSTKGLQHVTGDRMLASFFLALRALGVLALARRLDERTRRRVLGFRGVEHPYAHLDLVA